jgi:hypothetical protein
MFAFIHSVPRDEIIDNPGVVERIWDELGAEPLAGCLVHLVVQRADGTYQNINVWDNEESFAVAMRERIDPATERGFGPGNHPDHVGPPPIEMITVVHGTGMAFRV